MDFLGTPLGYLMDMIYSMVSNYGVTIVLLSILIKLITLPLTIKQQKSMAAMQQIQPLMSEVQKKYANDKEKQGQEMMNLYKQYNVSPFASCLPTLIQFPILIGLYAAIAKPLSFMLRLGQDQIKQLADLVGIVIEGANAYHYEIAVAKAASHVDFIEQAQAIAPNFKALDFNFIGLDLSLTPALAVLSVMWILPILSAGFTFLSSYVMQPANSSSQAQEMQSTQKFMMYFFPLFILYLGFQVPAGLSLYWTVNGALQLIQYFTLDKKMRENLSAEIAVTNAGMETKKTKKKRG